MKQPKGFTLIELLIVIAIIGILASITLVSLNEARVSANRASYIAFVSSATRSVEGVAVNGQFERGQGLYTGSNIHCIGNYSGSSCWNGARNEYLNGILFPSGAPEGPFSPYYAGTAYGVMAYALTDTWRLYAYTFSDGIDMCDQFGWEPSRITYSTNFCYVEFDY